MRNLWIPASVFAFFLGHLTAPAAPAPVVLPAPAPTVVVVDKPAAAPAVAPVVWAPRYWPYWGYNGYPSCMTTNMGCRFP